MRALISLYHQSESFITPENLSDRIDSAFTTSNDPLTRVFNPSSRLDDLRNLVKERRLQARFAESGPAETGRRLLRTSTMGSDWEESNAAREQKVVDALHGVDGGKPGLEVLEESTERVQQNVTDDLERSKHNY